MPTRRVFGDERDAADRDRAAGMTEPHHLHRVVAVRWRAAACYGVQFGHWARPYHVRPLLGGGSGSEP
jgi:hypothetical protein